MVVRRVDGVGLGMRWEFLDPLLAELPPLDFLEVSPENYMRRGGYYPAALAYAAEHYPVVTHGLTMSVGGTDPLDAEYLRTLRGFVGDIGSPWHSDHLCFGVQGGRVLHDLLPVPFKEGSIGRIADRIRRAQDALGVPMAIENISYYVHPGAREMSEPEFITRVCEAADCGLMLDVNNAYVNAVNFGYDVDAWMREVPLHRVVQMHVAGHDRFERPDGPLLIDTHGQDVPDPVLTLLGRVLRRTGPVPVVLERDQSFPPFPVLVDEVRRIRAVWDDAVRAHATEGA